MIETANIRIRDLEIPQDKITMGQGEYVVFHQMPRGEKRGVSKETFEKAYQIFNQYSPAGSLNRGSEKALEECANRYELIQTKIKQIDPSLEVVFIPRTLYELIFIRKYIKEDLKHGEICPWLAPVSQNPSLSLHFQGNQQKLREFIEEREADQTKRKCWHLCYFTDAGNNEHAGVKNIAYRLNQSIIKKFNPSSGGFTHKEHLQFAEKEIQFLKEHYQKSFEESQRELKGEKVHRIRDANHPGPTTNFGCESVYSEIKPMGIRNNQDAQIIQEAITLDCSKVAQSAFLIFRGADYQKDDPCGSDPNLPYSLSYGTGLFAGCIYDGGAMPFYYMRNEQNAYAMPIAYDQVFSSPFYIPLTNSIVQLFGEGETFHARSKAWKDVDLKEIQGVKTGTNGQKRGHLKSNFSKEEFIALFQSYKDKAIQLK